MQLSSIVSQGGDTEGREIVRGFRIVLFERRCWTYRQVSSPKGDDTFPVQGSRIVLFEKRCWTKSFLPYSVESSPMKCARTAMSPTSSPTSSTSYNTPQTQTEWNDKNFPGHDRSPFPSSSVFLLCPLPERDVLLSHPSGPLHTNAFF